MNLPKMTKAVIAAMRLGIMKSGDSGVTWIQQEVFDGQKYVGSKDYPDVKASTHAIKAKLGQEKVGIMTGNLRDSFDTHYSSDRLTVTIRGGGKGYGKFNAIWRIDRLFYKHRAMKSREIMDKEIKKAL
ncbi:MAG: hypothetical protein IMF19_12025 [Proteobacteria bacterium]|nr:hypothetical protein [Pseudomonadota bacterium]